MPYDVPNYIDAYFNRQHDSLKPYLDKVLAGERFSYDDAVHLYNSPDLLGVGMLAD